MEGFTIIDILFGLFVFGLFLIARQMKKSMDKEEKEKRKKKSLNRC